MLGYLSENEGTLGATHRLDWRDTCRRERELTCGITRKAWRPAKPTAAIPRPARIMLLPIFFFLFRLWKWICKPSLGKIIMFHIYESTYILMLGKSVYGTTYIHDTSRYNDCQKNAKCQIESQQIWHQGDFHSRYSTRKFSKMYNHF